MYSARLRYYTTTDTTTITHKPWIGDDKWECMDNVFRPLIRSQMSVTMHYNDMAIVDEEHSDR